jgi:16S rRNA (guanine527-N7)-methyltransferase
MTKGSAALVDAYDVSRETSERLQIYADLLEKWNPRINLVSKGTLGDLWTRHFRDSAQLLRLAPAEAGHWCDLGSGGGFPGTVIAILAQEHVPALAVTLVESDKRKATFLRTVARECGVSVTVIAERIEQITPQRSDVVSARALAGLPQLLGFAHRHLAPGGTALFPKGARHEQVSAESLALWQFRCETFPSETDPDAVILRISELSRA